MKKLLVLLSALFICTVAVAHTIEWYVDGSLYQTTTCNSGDNVTPPTLAARYGYHLADWKVEYTKLEYIESTGTQYIDLGTTINSTDIFDIEVAWTYLGSNCGFFVSKEETNWLQGRYIGIVHYDQQKGFYNRGVTVPYSGSMPTVLSPVVNEKNTIHWQPVTNQITFNGVIYTGASGCYCQTTNSFTSANAPYIFATNQAGTATQFDYAKLYSFRRQNSSGVLLQDLIPVLDSNGVPCLFDKVTEQYFYNQGTGQFVAGPVLNE